ncbi:MAG TPA: AtpZ/AtpI family protein [Chloroflexota bacterium]|nr:AtpZ/AtpI family protein [Chloroflexota bacterium]
MGQQQRNDRERVTLLRAMGVVSVCGLDLAVLILIGVLAGRFADSQLHSSPWGLLIGLFIGLIAGFYTAYLIIAPIVRSL